MGSKFLAKKPISRVENHPQGAVPECEDQACGEGKEPVCETNESSLQEFEGAGSDGGRGEDVLCFPLNQPTFEVGVTHHKTQAVSSRTSDLNITHIKPTTMRHVAHSFLGDFENKLFINCFPHWPVRPPYTLEPSISPTGHSNDCSRVLTGRFGHTTVLLG